ncbi:hypothetical protein ACFCWG_45585 [Streptomyces sp. NPDC056390]|uniref:hypothetical protein n=1 Tax=Streptomyces sp. NPDC056390 TaxID=3345806 RepID=UPI0035E1854C
MRKKGRLSLLGLIPPALLAIGLSLRAINGPHLWLGIPSLVWWLAGLTLSVSAVLAILELRNTGEPE